MHVGVLFCLFSRGYIFQSEVNGGNYRKPVKKLKKKQSPTFPLPDPLCTILSFSGLSAIASPNAL